MSNVHSADLIPLKRTLSFLILGQKGGNNRMRIIELLRDRPYNINQMAEKLGLNYRTIKHHIDSLLKYQLISSSKTGGYGEVFFLSPDLEGHMDVYDGIIQKIDTVKLLTDFTESPLFFKNVLQQTYEGVIIVDIEWDVFFWNKSATRIFGTGNEDILHWPLDIFSDERTFDEIKKVLAKDRRINDMETSGKDRSGKRLDISITIDPISLEKNKVIGYFILAMDISERKKIEAKLAMKRKTIEVIMENTGTGIAYLDDEFNFLNMNSAFAEGSGHKKEDLIGQNHFAIFPSEENEKIFQKVKSSGKTIEVFDSSLSFIDQPERGITYWDWALVPIKDDSDNVISLVLSLKETTSRVKTRRRIKPCQ